MYFNIVPMRERGRPRDQKEIRLSKPIRADVQIRLETRTPLGRASTVAEVHVVPPYEIEPMVLYDASVESMATNAGTITGVEIIDGVAYAQSWWVRSL
ncbi:hypothetical protein [Pseudomonas sp. Marseille-QA0892]